MCVDTTMHQYSSGNSIEGRGYFKDGVLYYAGLVQARISAARKKDHTSEGGNPDAASQQSAYRPY